MVAPALSVAVRPFADVARGEWTVRRALPWGLAILAFVVLFADPAKGLARDWWNDPDAGHGLLLAPVALWLAWKAGLRCDATPSPLWGGTLILGAVLLRALGSLAAEFFTQRFSIWLALVGITVFAFGWRQVRHWWLPFSLLLLSIPLPALITNKLAIPLQFRASKYGYALIEWRHIPVRQQGNVIVIAGQEPGQVFQLFVAENLRKFIVYRNFADPPMCSELLPLPSLMPKPSASCVAPPPSRRLVRVDASARSSRSIARGASCAAPKEAIEPETARRNKVRFIVRSPCAGSFRRRGRIPKDGVR